MLNKTWYIGVSAAWIAMLIVLPFTSLPLVQALTGADSVAAASGLVLPLLVVAWLVPLVLQRQPFPRQSLPLLAFALVALISTLLATFLEIPAYKGISALDAQVKALITLAIGLCFYLAAATWPVTEKRLEMSLRIINWTGLAIIFWSLTQAIAWEYYNRYPQWMRDINDLYSIGPLIRARVSGFTLEPSWLAHQLNLLYLPLWLSAAARRHTVHRFRLWVFNFEDLLLVGGTVVLFLTLSRVGLVAFLLMVGVILLKFTLRVAAWVKYKVSSSPRFPVSLRGLWQRSGIAVVLILFLLVYAAGLFGLAQGIKHFDRRMQTMFQIDLTAADPIMSYANRLLFASRLLYWQAGWGIFEERPMIGVGLGNAGFYFPQMLSQFAWTQFEVRDLVYRSNILLNIKSLWVRLLAETGVAGFAFFAGWIYLMWVTARYLHYDRWRTGQQLALAGQLIIIAFMAEGFSLDTFALPYLWIGLGLVTAAATAMTASSIPAAPVTEDQSK